jgi:hypothetical protein
MQLKRLHWATTAELELSTPDYAYLKHLVTGVILHFEIDYYTTTSTCISQGGHFQNFREQWPGGTDDCPTFPEYCVLFP